MAHDVKAVLGAGGTLSRRLPNYEPRPAQLTMAAQVEEALARGRALVVEAGTGTGKTLAYLVPAALSGLKVVVSTATKNLQEQLAEKDVPLLKELGVDAKVAFMKGRQNYLCLLRKEQVGTSPQLFADEGGAQLEEILRWSETTETGDRAELAGLPDSSAPWRELTSTADSCTGQKCSHFDACFVFKMRRRAADADVVVVNHHLFFADLALRSSSAGDQGAAVIPRYDAVIFDEAHAIEEVATEHFGSSLSSFRASELAKDVLRSLATRPSLDAAHGLAQRLLADSGHFFRAAQESAPEALRDSFQGGPRRRRPGEDSLSARWPLGPGSLDAAEGERRELVELLRALAAELSRGADEDDEIALLERRASGLAQDLGLFAGALQAAGESPTRAVSRERIVRDEDPEPAPQPKAPASGVIHWAELRAGTLHLHASPVEIGSLLQDRLYDRIGPVVFTSATLAVAGPRGAPSLEYFKRRIGLADEEGPLFPTDEAVLASPFDYEKSAALYLPGTLPDPQDEGFPMAVAEELRALFAIFGGRAFALFTSLRNMRTVHALLADSLPYPTLLQGEKPKAQLLRQFKEAPSVLFATHSFWEGVDVQGDALQLVAIDKLPFASPQEPLVAARIDRERAQGHEPFYDYQVPQAALALKQGFGRLIRSTRDQGVVAILDRRVTAKSYGRLFVQSLPRCPVLRTRDEVARFWSRTRRN